MMNPWRQELNNNSFGTCGHVRTLCNAGRLKEVLHILTQGGNCADSISYVCVLRECIKMKGLAEGKQVHTHIIESGFKPNVFLLNTLVNMYAKCGSVVDARRVFDKMSEQDVFTWNIMIAGYARHGCAREAFTLYEKMQQQGWMPNRVTFICLLNACASLVALGKGKEVHAAIIKAGILPDIIVETALVDMYAKCRSMKDARQVFDSMPERTVVSWTAMITQYAHSGRGRDALEMYEQMIWEGVSPNKVTFIGVLNACASLAALDKGKGVHSDIIKAGIGQHIILENALVDMYAKCGSVNNARLVFDNMAEQDVVSWSTMIAGYAQHECGREALEMYGRMQRKGVTPNRVTFICILKACASLTALETGKKVHADIIKAGIALDIILDSALVDMYAKCGSIKDARRVFDTMSERNVVSWTAMIAGYAQHGSGREAMEIYEQMIWKGVTPDKVTFHCVLTACASMAALEKGMAVHADMIKAGIVTDISLDTALVDMYAKCGNMKDARQVFNNMAERDLVSWSAMIAGYGQHGYGRDALHLFEKMQQEGLKPSNITFTCLLSACSHAGLLDEGRHYFDSMSRNHALTHNVEHFGCMVDLLGRAGRLDEAEDFVNNMPVEPGALVWGTLLGAYKIHGDFERAERAAKCLLKLDPCGEQIVST